MNEKRPSVVIRKILAAILFAAIFLMYMMERPLVELTNYWPENYELFLPFYTIIALSVILLINHEYQVQEVHVRKLLMLLWVAFGVYAMYTFDKFQELNYFYLAIVMMVIIPVMAYMSISRQNYERLFWEISVGLEIAFIFFVVYSLLYYPMGPGNMYGNRYTMATTNPNYAGTYAACCMTAALYLTFKSRKMVVLHAIIAGGSAGIIFLTASRTSLVAFALEAFVFIVIFFRFRTRKSNKKKHNVLLKIVIFILVLGAIGGTSYLLINNINKSDLKKENTTLLDRVESDYELYTDGFKTETRESLKATNLPPSWEAINADRTFKKDNFDPTTKVLAIDKLSNGRTLLWRIYGHYLTMRGHDHIERREMIIRPFHLVTSIKSPHNNIIEYAYTMGIPAAIIYILINIYSWFWVLRCMLAKTTFEPYKVFASLTIVGFLPFMMLENSFFPIKLIMLVWCMAMIPLFDREINKDSRFRGFVALLQMAGMLIFKRK